MNWARESLADAIKFAYKDGPLDAFRGSTLHDFTSIHLDPDDVPEVPNKYLANALSIANVRVALTGFRLADVLGGLLK
jgi:hypothetical protein